MKDLGAVTSDLTQTSTKRRTHVIIVGGGASGVLMAAHLLSCPTDTFGVTIIEGRNMLGCGVAYSTTDPDHLLNTRIHNMSAYPDDPHHFHDWLVKKTDSVGISDQSFVSRATYGAYMASLLAPWSGIVANPLLRYVRQTCLRVQETARGVVAYLDDGRALTGDMIVLATGHAQADPDKSGVISGPWEPVAEVDPDSRIVIVGSGLSMVDQVLSILKSGHRGEILAISRRGQLPRAHEMTKPIKLGLGDIPFGAPISAYMVWVRDLAQRATRDGGTWRDAVDGIRPHIRSIWRGLPPVEKARFLRHAATWWDVHRHRIPPASDSAIKAALGTGQLILRRAAFLGAEMSESDGRMVDILPFGVDQPVRLSASRIIDCRGIRRDPERNATPLVKDLLTSGQARVDGLRISLDVTAKCQLISKAGKPSHRVYAIGPASRAAFWEITAISDIREQVAALSAELTLA